MATSSSSPFCVVLIFLSLIFSRAFWTNTTLYPAPHRAAIHLSPDFLRDYRLPYATAHLTIIISLLYDPGPGSDQIKGSLLLVSIITFFNYLVVTTRLYLVALPFVCVVRYDGVISTDLSCV